MHRIHPFVLVGILAVAVFATGCDTELLEDVRFILVLVAAVGSILMLATRNSGGGPGDLDWDDIERMWSQALGDLGFDKTSRDGSTVHTQTIADREVEARLVRTGPGSDLDDVLLDVTAALEAQTWKGFTLYPADAQTSRNREEQGRRPGIGHPDLDDEFRLRGEPDDQALELLADEDLARFLVAVGDQFRARIDDGSLHFEASALDEPAAVIFAIRMTAEVANVFDAAAGRGELEDDPDEVYEILVGEDSTDASAQQLDPAPASDSDAVW